MLVTVLKFKLKMTENFVLFLKIVVRKTDEAKGFEVRIADEAQQIVLGVLLPHWGVASYSRRIYQED